MRAWGDLWLGKADERRRYDLRTCLKLVVSFVGLRATLLYRLSHRAHQKRIRFLPQLLYQLNLFLFGLDIPPNIPIGPGLYIPHPLGNVVMAERIGSRVTLVSNVTIGMRRELVFPIIGDDVYVGAGARVLGPIRVGNNVSIGANAVVLKDVPDNSTAVGVPAQIRPAAASVAES
jgi:serine O-acetyltransferase